MDSRLRLSWTKEEDELLALEWGKGQTLTQMMPLFPERTKNSLIGRVHRLGLSRNGATPVASKLKKPTGAPPRRRSHPFKIKTRIVVSDMVLNPPALASKHDVPLMELRSHNCRSIVSMNGGADGLATFCRNAAIEGRSFCHKHAALYYDRRPRRRV